LDYCFCSCKVIKKINLLFFLLFHFLRFSFDFYFFFFKKKFRGGGELGPKWYTDGKLLKKENSFQDFIHTAEYLISRKYTSPTLLCARGVSAGALLVGDLTFFLSFFLSYFIL